MDPGKYIDCMEEACVQHFETKPVQRHRSPLHKRNYPEVDAPPFLNEKEKEIYMSLVGSNQGSVSIGGFNIQSAIMTISRYWSAPRRGYLDQMKSIYGYLCKLLGKRILLTHYFDASLMYDVLSGKAVTGVCTFYNKTPIDWYCK